MVDFAWKFNCLCNYLDLQRTGLKHSLIFAIDIVRLSCLTLNASHIESCEKETALTKLSWPLSVCRQAFHLPPWPALSWLTSVLPPRKESSSNRNMGTYIRMPRIVLYCPLVIHNKSACISNKLVWFDCLQISSKDSTDEGVYLSPGWVSVSRSSPASHQLKLLTNVIFLRKSTHGSNPRVTANLSPTSSPAKLPTFAVVVIWN